MHVYGEHILTFIFAKDLLLATQIDQARDILASTLTQRRGELVFRIGSRPPHDKLFADEPIAETDQLQGRSRSAEDIDVICARVSQAVEEFGGKVSLLRQDLYICAGSYITTSDVDIIQDPVISATCSTITTITSTQRSINSRGTLRGGGERR